MDTMTRRTQLQVVLIVALIVACALSASAGEVKLRGWHQAKASLVKLGDLAELIDVPDDQRHQVESLPLFPSPRAGLVRRVTAQDVRETMSLYGLSYPTLRVTGECRVEGRSSTEPERPDVATTSLDVAESTNDSLSTAVAHQLRDALIAYLQTKDRIRTEWRVDPLLTAEQAQAIATFKTLEVSGGHAPWTGRQFFTVRERAASSKPVSFNVDVQRVARAVATTRHLAAGDVIGPADVELAEVNPLSLSTTVVLNVDDALGKETKRAIPAGQIVQTSMLQRPLVVKRGELVAVYSLAAGVQVKATAKSLGDGALGDVILLEATENNKRFQARVTAPQEAMVFVDTPSVAAENKKPNVSESPSAQKIR